MCGLQHLLTEEYFLFSAANLWRDWFDTKKPTSISKWVKRQLPQQISQAPLGVLRRHSGQFFLWINGHCKKWQYGCFRHNYRIQIKQSHFPESLWKRKYPLDQQKERQLLLTVVSPSCLDVGLVGWEKRSNSMEATPKPSHFLSPVSSESLCHWTQKVRWQKTGPSCSTLDWDTSWLEVAMTMGTRQLPQTECELGLWVRLVLTIHIQTLGHLWLHPTYHAV